jgi:hypothetical protein
MIFKFFSPCLKSRLLFKLTRDLLYVEKSHGHFGYTLYGTSKSCGVAAEQLGTVRSIESRKEKS